VLRLLLAEIERLGWGEWARPKRKGFLEWKSMQEGVLVAVVEEMAWDTPATAMLDLVRIRVAAAAEGMQISFLFSFYTMWISNVF